MGRAVSILYGGAFTIWATAVHAQTPPPAPAGETFTAPPYANGPAAQPPPPGPQGTPAAPPAYSAPQQPPPNYYQSGPTPAYPPNQPPTTYPTQPAAPQPVEWRASKAGLIVTVERAFGFYFSTGTRGGVGQASAIDSVGDSDLSGTSVNLLGGSPMGASNPFSVPFIAVHGAVGGFTVGGGVGYQTDSQERGLQTTDLRALTVAPRVGYIFDLGRVVSVWIRGGVTYSSQTTERSSACAPGATFCTPQSSKQTFSMFDLSVDPMFVFSPIPHLGLLLGPTIDVALSGTVDTGPITTFTDPNSPPLSPERDLRLSSFGVAAGAALFF